MKAMRIHDYGSFEQLKHEDIEVPAIQDDQILVKVYATSVNHLDLKKASGVMKERMPLKFPWIPGHDFSGVVEKTGSEVSGVKKGDRVYGNCRGGSYAEYLVANLKTTVKIPDALSFAAASSVPHVAETAWQALYKHGLLQKGQTLLVHGGAGAVGGFAIQFARNTGAKILATAGSEDIDYVKSLGADRVVNYKTEDFTQVFANVDLVLSLVGGDTEEKSYSVLKRGGRLVSTVGLAHEEVAKSKGITAVAMVIEQLGEDLRKITELIEEGNVKTDIGVRYPLEEAAEAWQVLSGDKSVKHRGHGKVILEIIKE